MASHDKGTSRAKRRRVEVESSTIASATATSAATVTVTDTGCSTDSTTLTSLTTSTVPYSGEGGGEPQPQPAELSATTTMGQFVKNIFYNFIATASQKLTAAGLLIKGQSLSKVRVAHKQDPLNVTGKLVNVVLLPSAGFTEYDASINATPLYTRQAVVDLWNHLELKGKPRPKVEVFYIRGDPGCGKSCVVWAWCCYQVTKHGKSVFWVSLKSLLQGVLLSNTSHDGTFTATEFPMEDLTDKTSFQGADILVIDGVMREHTTDLPRCPWNRYRAFFVVTSQQFPLKYEETIQHSFTLLAWEKAEFILALKADKKALLTWITKSFPEALCSGNTVEEKVNHKYYFAGRSARWMFEFKIEDVKTFIHYHIEHCGDVNALIAEACGAGSSFAVNHLISVLPSNKFDIISKYAIYKLSQSCSLKKVKSAKRVLSGYPTALGFLFEMEFLVRLRAGKKKGDETVPKLLRLRDKSARETTEKWGFTKEYSQEDFFAKDAAEYAENDWIIPQWNQASYDFVQIHGLRRRPEGALPSSSSPTSTTSFERPEFNLRFVQLTIADSHPFNPSPVTNFVAALQEKANVADVEFVFVVPADNLLTFKYHPDAKDFRFAAEFSPSPPVSPSSTSASRTSTTAAAAVTVTAKGNKKAKVRVVAWN